MSVMIHSCKLNERKAMQLESLQQALKQYSTAEISYKSGISIATIDQIKNGIRKNPSYKTITALADFLEKKKDET